MNRVHHTKPKQDSCASGTIRAWWGKLYTAIACKVSRQVQACKAVHSNPSALPAHAPHKGQTPGQRLQMQLLVLLPHAFLPIHSTGTKQGWPPACTAACSPAYSPALVRLVPCTAPSTHGYRSDRNAALLGAHAASQASSYPASCRNPPNSAQLHDGRMPGRHPIRPHPAPCIANTTKWAAGAQKQTSASAHNHQSPSGCALGRAPHAPSRCGTRNTARLSERSEPGSERPNHACYGDGSAALPAGMARLQ